MRFLVLIATLVLIFSCKKDDFYEDPNTNLNFSSDTISFDTIFTSFGTLTKRLMVYNPYNQSILISSVKLAKGGNSPFIINVNGENNREVNNVTIAAKDSLYVFIQMYLNQAGQDLPLFVKDSILFETNGNLQNVKLIAYAQDVNIFRDSVIQTQTWSPPKPYLIIGYLEIDSAQTLTIEPGVVIYFKKDAFLFASGRIIANGSFYNPIIFRQERSDDVYDEIPGQWGGIFLFSGSNGHQFNWVTIKNGTFGVFLGWDNYPYTPSLEMNNVIIKNMSFGCLYAYNGEIHASNCVIANGKYYNCYLFGGGEYQFYHSTITNYYSNYYTYDPRELGIPSLYLSNYTTDTAGIFVINDLQNTYFRNCIIYGLENNEIGIDMKEDVTYDVSFDHCLIRGTIPENYNGLFTNTIINKDPKFIEKDEKLNFELDTLSPAKDAGLLVWGSYVPFDLNNKSRLSDDGPDLGAYERKE